MRPLEAAPVESVPPPTVETAPELAPAPAPLIKLDPATYPFDLYIAYQASSNTAPVMHKNVRGWRHSDVILKCYETAASKRAGAGVDFPVMIPFHECYVDFVGNVLDRDTDGMHGGGSQVLPVLMRMLSKYELVKLKGFKPKESPIFHENTSMWLYSMLRPYTTRDVLLLYFAAQFLQVDVLLRPLMYCLVANLHFYPIERARLLHTPAKMRNDVVKWNASSAMVADVVGDVLRVMASVRDGGAVDQPNS